MIIVDKCITFGSKEALFSGSTANVTVSGALTRFICSETEVGQIAGAMIPLNGYVSTMGRFAQLPMSRMTHLI